MYLYIFRHLLSRRLFLCVVRGAISKDEHCAANDLSPLHYTSHVSAVGHKDITVDTALPANLPKKFLAQNHHQRSFNWVLKDSYFHDFYGRFLVYTPWARITGNQITRSYLHIGTGAASFDGGGISSNVLVDSNVLIATSADTGLWGISSTYPVLQNITFADNSFIGEGLTLNNTGNALITDNYFEAASSPAKPSLPLQIRDSIDPRIIGNREEGIGLTTFGLESTRTDGLTDTENGVVTIPATHF
jgi:acetyltransferase-like isoleucine patch superfamily enzyme